MGRWLSRQGVGEVAVGEAGGPLLHTDGVVKLQWEGMEGMGEVGG